MNDTPRLMKIIWDAPSSQEQVLAGFFGLVQQGATRPQIDRWLYEMIDGVPQQRQLLFLNSIDLDHVAWGQMTEFLCACFYASRRRSAFPDVPLERDWQDLTYREQLLAPHPQRGNAIKYTVPLPVLPLEAKLLSYGGKRMVYVGEPDLQALLERGIVFEEVSVLIRGEPSHCHENAARMWNEAREVYSIATGYALSADGLWRQHSWLLRNHPTGRQHRLIETTVKRVKYFGIILDEQDAEEFVSMIGP